MTHSILQMILKLIQNQVIIIEEGKSNSFTF